MRKLDETQQAKLLNTIGPLTKKKTVKAVCIYGSHVSGYSRQDSDYDVVILLSPFGQKIKYNYVKDEVECSALVVDSKSFQNDCARSTLGEFVAGRFLNPYQAISGADFVFENEVNYKERVILEGIYDCYAEYGHLAEDLEFPLKYFLFDKLRKRAAIYPPVVYSYSKTYGKENLDSNLEYSLQGFRKAASNLEAENTIKFDVDNDNLRIHSSKFKSGIGARLSLTASYTARGIRQYAIHGYAGRVGIDVVGKEVISKLSRASKDHSELPEWIRDPKLSWRLPGAKLFPKTSDWLSDMLSEFGMERASTEITKKALGEIYNSTMFYRLSDRSNGKSLSIAVKRFTDVKGMKWGLLNVWSLRNTDFTANALERLHREYSANVFFRSIGIPTSEILGVFINERIMISRFIQGKDLSQFQSDYFEGKTEDLSEHAAYGAILAKVHRSGYSVGDSKPSNAILSCEKIYLTDLEQSHPGGNPVWDIAEFIFYSVRLTLREDRARKLVNSFIEGYVNGGGDPKVIEQAASLRYRAPFQAFIAPNVLTSLRKDLSKVS